MKSHLLEMLPINYYCHHHHHHHQYCYYLLKGLTVLDLVVVFYFSSVAWIVHQLINASAL